MTTPSILPPPAAQHLHEVLELEQLDTNLFRSRVNQINNNRSLFGGQILAQGLKAAALTVEPGRRAHSLHGYFLLAGMSDVGVIYDVELTRDGGSFSTRRARLAIPPPPGGPRASPPPVRFARARAAPPAPAPSGLASAPSRSFTWS